MTFTTAALICAMLCAFCFLSDAGALCLVFLGFTAVLGVLGWFFDERVRGGLE